MREIVGIARTANYTSWGEPPQTCVYLPLEQNQLPAMTLYIRGAGADPASQVGRDQPRDRRRSIRKC